MKNLLGLLLSLFICTFSISTAAQVTGQEDTIIPTYNGDNGILEKIIGPKCLGCHSSQLSGESERSFAPEGVNFDTFEGAKEQGDKIVTQAVELMRMPPNSAPKLNDNEKQALKNWMVLGFPEETLPTHYIVADQTLILPEVFIIDADGNNLIDLEISSLSLNTEQAEALKGICNAGDLSLLNGKPGTGKSFLIYLDKNEPTPIKDRNKPITIEKCKILLP